MARRVAVLRLLGDIEERPVRRLISALDRAVADGAREVCLSISSQGGNVHWGLTLHNVLRALPVPVTTVNAGFANSMAAAVYCAGDRRLCAPEAKFLLHPAAAYPDVASGGISTGRLRERLRSLEVDCGNLAAIVARATGRPRRRVLQDLEERLALDARAACAYGLAHRVSRRLPA